MLQHERDLGRLCPKCPMAGERQTYHADSVHMKVIFLIGRGQLKGG